MQIVRVWQRHWTALRTLHRMVLGADQWGNRSLADRIDLIERKIDDLREEIERIDSDLDDKVYAHDIEEQVDAAKCEAIEAIVTALHRL